MKKFLVRAGLLVVAIVIARALFQFPIEYFGWGVFRQTDANRLFSKIDALKVLAVASIFFGLYYKEKLSSIKYDRLNIPRTVGLLGAALAFIVLYYVLRASTNIYGIESGFSLALIWLGILLALGVSFIFFVLAVFTPGYVRKLYSIMKYELITAAAVCVILYNALMLFQKQWFFFSNIVSKVLYSIFSLFYTSQFFYEGMNPILVINGFAVSIAAPCSGIDSMLLYLAFMSGIFALDKDRLNLKAFLPMVVLGFVGVYCVNIIRLFLLILIGVHISPELAVGFFHTQAGWLLFLVYFLGLYWVVRRYAYK